MRKSIKHLLALAVGGALATGISGLAIASPANQTTYTVQVASNAKFGNILVNAGGMTLYTLSSEANVQTTGNFQCTASCESFWPPLKLKSGQSAPNVPAGVPGTFSAAGLPDYSLQVTYNGFPLYTFGQDAQPGDTKGDGIQGPGAGTWHVVQLTAGTQPTATATTTTTTTTTPSELPLQVADSALGKVLVDAQGMTLYYLTSEKASTGTLACKGGCLAVWPVVGLPAGQTTPSAGSGVTGTLSAFTRNDNSTQQVTYNDLPLYRFSHDAKPGDTKGEGIQAFGGTWHAALVDNTPLATRITLHITKTGKKIWGKVTASYTATSGKASSKCAKATCNLVLPAGATVTLSEKPANAKTWPFAGWKISTAGSTTKTVHKSKTKVGGNELMTVTAVYKLHK